MHESKPYIHLFTKTQPLVSTPIRAAVVVLTQKEFDAALPEGKLVIAQKLQEDMVRDAGDVSLDPVMLPLQYGATSNDLFRCNTHT